jgi:hypothetical protein
VLFAQKLHLSKEAKSDSLLLDFCDTCSSCNKATFEADLKRFNLCKGDFFTVKIRNINPYRYTIKITANHDTFSAGQEPALFTEFMAPSSLASLAANIFSSSPVFSAATPESREIEDPAKYIKQINGQFLLNENKLSGDFPNEYNKLKLVLEKSIEINRRNRIRIDSLKKVLTAQTELMEKKYALINECYQSSVQNILNFETDCFAKAKTDCFKEADCKCVVSEQTGNIAQLLEYKSKIRKVLDELAELQGLGKDSAKIYDELNSKKYTSVYLTSIHTKTYSNFLIARNTKFLSTYYSFPIQVQGDMLELKIDITPKGAGDDKKKEEDKKEDGGKDNEKTAGNNQTVYVYTSKENDAKKSEKSDSEGDGSGKADDTVSDKDLKLSSPSAAREYHLNYKFRTNRFFYGFSSGFFLDNLKDEQYANKPVDVNDPAAGFKLVQEEKTIGKVGIMATVNTGIYLGQKSNAFLHLFAGPGLTFETKLQPRLLVGAGIGKGDRNKFSLNGGLIVGQVKRLSGIFDTGTTYSSPQTDLYYTTNAASWFVSINYVFDLTK